jgi:hypothetical protein
MGIFPMAKLPNNKHQKEVPMTLKQGVLVAVFIVVAIGLLYLSHRYS